MNLAVYTAQEGHAWQPGTVFSPDDLLQFKKAIGKFPSPDSMDFPFGGVFLLDDRVVFYRYHVAKKIDFRGRDALYCVLGAVSREEAAKIDPSALFACPEFAGPMKPFPVSVELPDADPAAVPEWLKNLDKMTLDVRITGTADNPSYAVVQNPVKVPEPPPEPPLEPPPELPAEKPPVEVPKPVTTPGGSESAVPDPDPVPPSPDANPVKVSHPAGGSCPTRSQTSRWIFLGTASAALMVVLLAVVALLLLCPKGGRDPQESNVPSGNEKSKTNNVQESSHSKNTNDVSKATATADGASSATNSVVVATNAVASATNVLTVATNAAPIVKAVAAPISGKKIVPSQASPKVPAKGQKKNLSMPKRNSPAAKKMNSSKRRDSKGKQ